MDILKKKHEVEGTPETECWYFPVLPDLNKCTDIIQFLKVMKFSHSHSHIHSHISIQSHSQEETHILIIFLGLFMDKPYE